MGEAARPAFQAGDSIRVSIGEEFLISLQEPGASGYLYEPVLPADLVSLASATRQPSAAPGASGTVLFRFRTKRVGTGELAFELRAPWKDEAASRISFSVSIQP